MINRGMIAESCEGERSQDCVQPSKGKTRRRDRKDFKVENAELHRTSFKIQLTKLDVTGITAMIAARSASAKRGTGRGGGDVANAPIETWAWHTKSIIPVISNEVWDRSKTTGEV